MSPQSTLSDTSKWAGIRKNCGGKRFSVRYALNTSNLCNNYTSSDRPCCTESETASFEGSNDSVSATSPPNAVTIYWASQESPKQLFSQMTVPGKLYWGKKMCITTCLTWHQESWKSANEYYLPWYSSSTYFRTLLNLSFPWHCVSIPMISKSCQSVSELERTLSAWKANTPTRPRRSPGSAASVLIYPREWVNC